MDFTWLDTGSGAICVRVDVPADRRAHAALVVIPSFGRDATVAFRTWRTLAVKGCARGFVVISPWLTGQGDSPPSDLVDNLSGAWSEDVAAATRLARELVGDRPTHLVGLRLGGCLAAAEPAFPQEMRVMWQPISGTAFLRSQRALRNFAVTVPPAADCVELYAESLTPAQAESLHVLRRAESNANIHVRSEAGDVARHLFGVSTYHTQVPMGAVESVLDLLPVGEPSPVRGWQPRHRREYDIGGGVRVVDELVRVGPRHVPAILTLPVHGKPRAAVLFMGMGTELKCGPGQLWTRLSQDLARAGAASLRTDRHLLGECLDTRDPCEPPAYTEVAVGDVVEALTVLADRSGRVPMGVGVCAGAWCLLRASARTPVAAIMAVNSLHWNVDTRAFDDAFYARVNGEEIPLLNEGAGVDTRTKAGSDQRLLLRWNPALLVRRVKGRAVMQLPRLAAVLQRRQPPARVRELLDLVPATTGLRLVMGESEYLLFKGNRGRAALRARRSSGARSTVRVLPGLDHSLASQRSRTLIGEAIRAFVDAELSDDGGPGATSQRVRAADRSL